MMSSLERGMPAAVLRPLNGCRSLRCCLSKGAVLVAAHIMIKWAAALNAWRVFTWSTLNLWKTSEWHHAHTAPVRMPPRPMPPSLLEKIVFSLLLDQVACMRRARWLSGPRSFISAVRSCFCRGVNCSAYTFGRDSDLVPVPHGATGFPHHATPLRVVTHCFH